MHTLNKTAGIKIHLLLIVLLLFSNSAFCEVYKWVDEHGETHYGDSKPMAVQSKSMDLKVNSYESVSIDATTIVEKSDEVVMYATDWCGYCKKARRYFNENSIPYTEYDIEKDAEAKIRYDEMGGKGVPVILFGDRRMNGFSISQFRRIYN